MAKSYFKEKELQPQDENLKAVLSKAKEYWDKYLDIINTSIPEAAFQWKYYGKAWGWCLVGLVKNKNLLYLTPIENGFYVSFVFNEQNRQCAREEGMSEEILKTIEAGKSNNAGHTFDILVQNKSDLEIVSKLLKIKSNII